MKAIFNAGLFVLLSSASAFAGGIGGALGGAVPIVAPIQALGGALAGPVAAAGFVGGVSMIGFDMYRHHSMSEVSSKGIITLGAGAFSVIAGNWLSLYGVTGALI